MDADASEWFKSSKEGNEKELIALADEECNTKVAVNAFIKQQDSLGQRSIHFAIKRGMFDWFQYLILFAEQQKIDTDLFECVTNDKKTLMHHIVRVCSFVDFSRAFSH